MTKIPLLSDDLVGLRGGRTVRAFAQRIRACTRCAFSVVI